MASNWTDTQIAEAVARSVDESSLHSAFRGLVRQLLLSESSEWNLCCGGDCDPCVDDLSQAVTRAREILAESP